MRCCARASAGKPLTSYTVHQLDSEEEEIRDAAEQIAAKKAKIKKLSQAKNTLKNRPIIPRKQQHTSLKEFTTGMRKIGLDPKTIEKRAAKMIAARKKAYEEAEAEQAEGGADGMDVDMEGAAEDAAVKPMGRAGRVALRAPRTNRQLAGMATMEVSMPVWPSASECSAHHYTLSLVAIRQGEGTPTIRFPRTEPSRQGFRVRSSHSDHEAQVDVGGKEEGGKDRPQIELLHSLCSILIFLFPCLG
jgi:hypothetical protein